MSLLIVEFFGMPGVGKTFIAKQLIQSLRQDGFQVSDRIILLGQGCSLKRALVKTSTVIRCLFLDHNTFRIVLSFLQNFKIRGVREKLKLIFNWIYLVILVRVESRTSKFIVLDQGFGQAFWSTIFYGETRLGDVPSSHLIEQFLKILPIGSLIIVHVHAHDECIERRLKGRKDGRSPLDRDRDGAWQRAVQVTCEARSMLDQLQGCMPSIHIMDVSNHSDGLNITELERIKESVSIKETLL